jgi:exodeoxyribonuclease VII large subunit
MNKEYINVSDINRIIKYTIEGNEELRDVYIKGEISNFKPHSRGHLYFSLKDESSRINAVMFNYERAGLNFEPKDGDSVLVHGRISVYEATGSYQIYVDSMEIDGIGNLYILFEKLKKKLAEEGLFDPEHKKKIRRVPKKIGVITAPTGAAIRDIISTINKRFPMTEIYVFPTLVQGDAAAENIVRAIHQANEYDDIDTIILGRGGGSIEDLWAFNEEIVARAIYKSRIPIISGVGHEIDFTISDFVADLRAPTPTGAAMLAVPDINEVQIYFKNALERSNNAILNLLNNCTQTVLKFKTNYLLNNPKALYEMKEQKLDNLFDRINNAILGKLDKANHVLDKYKSNYLLNNPQVLLEGYKTKIEHLKVKAELLNPQNILDKGYSIVYKEDKIVKDSSKLKENDEIKIVVNKGKITANVKGVE